MLLNQAIFQHFPAVPRCPTVIQPFVQNSGWCTTMYNEIAWRVVQRNVDALLAITTPKAARHASSVMQLKKSPRAVVVGLLVTCTLPSESSDDALPHQLEIHNSDSEVWLVSH